MSEQNMLIFFCPFPLHSKFNQSHCTTLDLIVKIKLSPNIHLTVEISILLYHLTLPGFFIGLFTSKYIFVRHLFNGYSIYLAVSLVHKQYFKLIKYFYSVNSLFDIFILVCVIFL